MSSLQWRRSDQRFPRPVVMAYQTIRSRQTMKHKGNVKAAISHQAKSKE